MATTTEYIDFAHDVDMVDVPVPVFDLMTVLPEETDMGSPHSWVCQYCLCIGGDGTGGPTSAVCRVCANKICKYFSEICSTPKGAIAAVNATWAQGWNFSQVTRLELLKAGIQPNPGPARGRGGGRGRGRGRGGKGGGGRRPGRTRASKNATLIAQSEARGVEEKKGIADGMETVRLEQTVANIVQDALASGRVPLPPVPRMMPLPSAPPLSALVPALPPLPRSAPPPLPPYVVKGTACDGEGYFSPGAIQRVLLRLRVGVDGNAGVEIQNARSDVQDAVAHAKFLAAQGVVAGAQRPAAVACANRAALLPAPPVDGPPPSAVMSDAIDILTEPHKPGKSTAQKDRDAANALITAIGYGVPTDIPGLTLPDVDEEVGCCLSIARWLKKKFCCAIGLERVPKVICKADELNHLDDCRSVDDLGTPSLRPNPHNFWVAFPQREVWCAECPAPFQNVVKINRAVPVLPVSATLFADLHQITLTPGKLDPKSLLDRVSRLAIDVKAVTVDTQIKDAAGRVALSRRVDMSMVREATALYYVLWHQRVERLFPNVTSGVAAAPTR